MGQICRLLMCGFPYGPQVATGPGLEGQLSEQHTELDPSAEKHWLGKEEPGSQTLFTLAVELGPGATPPGAGVS